MSNTNAAWETNAGLVKWLAGRRSSMARQWWEDQTKRREYQYAAMLAGLKTINPQMDGFLPNVAISFCNHQSSKHHSSKDNRQISSINQEWTSEPARSAVIQVFKRSAQAVAMLASQACQVCLCQTCLANAGQAPRFPTSYCTCSLAMAWNWKNSMWWQRKENHPFWFILGVDSFEPYQHGCIAVLPLFGLAVSVPCLL